MTHGEQCPRGETDARPDITAFASAGRLLRIAGLLSEQVCGPAAGDGVTDSGTE